MPPRHPVGNPAAGPYELYGHPHFYEPDFLVRLTNGVNVVLEIKGQSQGDTEARHQAARRWVSAVNHWGRLGEWGFLVCRDPQRLDEGIARLLAARQSRLSEVTRASSPSGRRCATALPDEGASRR